MSLMFGNLTQDFVNFSIAIQSIDRNDPQSSRLIEEAARNFRHVAAKDASYLTYIGTWIPISPLLLTDVILNQLWSSAGAGTFVCIYIYMCTWVFTSEVTAKRIRERYLKAVLRQEIAFFDKVGAGEVTTRIQTDTRM